jgi:hypothetical protein
MKSLVRLGVAASLLCVAVAANAQRGHHHRDGIFYQGRRLSFSPSDRPIPAGGTLLVSIRPTADQIGARVDRTKDGLRVWITLGRDKVEYNKGHRWYRINGNRKNLGAISTDRYGILFVPIDMFVDLTRGRLQWRR